jgi:hypothetical protein
MQDNIQKKLPKWLLPYIGSLTYSVKIREIKPDARVHPTVVERFALKSVTKCAGSGPYRPEALAQHDEFKAYYTTSVVQNPGHVTPA